jgi:hypothetical protein
VSFEGTHHLARLRKALERSLAEGHLAIEAHLEASVHAAPQLNCPHDRRPIGKYLARQAHGLVKIVSRNAELDDYDVFWMDQSGFTSDQ